MAPGQPQRDGMDSSNGPPAVCRERILAALEQSRDPLAAAAFGQTAEWRALVQLARSGTAAREGTPEWLGQVVEAILAAGMGGGQLKGLRRVAAAVAASIYEDAECRGRVQTWWRQVCEVAR